MEELIALKTTWAQLGATAFWLAVLYVFLKILERWLALGKSGGLRLGGRFRAVLSRIVGKVLVLFEMVAVAVLLPVFVFISPLKHGALTIVLLAAGFSSLRNFINGRMLLLDNTFEKAERMRTTKGEGSIARRGRFGFYLRTDDGLLHVPYSQVVSEGYSLIAGGDMGSLYHMRFSPKAGEEAPAQELSALLAMTPYLDRAQASELAHAADGTINGTLLLRDSKYLSELTLALEEAGWQTTLRQ